MMPARPDPELIVLTARTHTLHPRVPWAEAIAIADGRVLALGSRRRMLRDRRRATRVLDLRDAVVTPGLVDCHTHFFYWALGNALVIDVTALSSLNAVLQRIHKLAPTRRAGEWTIVRGFDYNRWGRGLPCAADLDAVVKDHPVIAHSRDGHTAWLNSAALRRAGITRRTPDPKGGRYVRDARGNPTGIVQELAIDLLPNPLRELARRTDADAQRIIDRALRAAYRTAWACGIVGVHSMDDCASLAQLARHHTERWLGIRVVHAVNLPDFEHALELGLRSGLGDDWFRVGGLKVYADGALGSQTAYMFKPYPGQKHFFGVAAIAADQLQEVAVRAARHGWALWIHAIGDRAVHESIVAIDAARQAATPPIPNRIEHAQCVRPADVRWMARAGIIGSVQPCHILCDIPIADRHWPTARKHAFPLRSLLNAGVTLAAGSDVPIESIDPRRSLFGATARMSETGQPASGWFPEQRISRLAALRSFTRGAAASLGAPLPAGTLAPGARADLTIWAEDPLRVAPRDLLHIGIRGCVVAGQVHLTADA